MRLAAVLASLAAACLWQAAGSAPALAASGDSTQEDMLRRQADLGRSMSDRELEDQSVRRLRLVTGSGDPSWLLYQVRMLCARGGAEREQAEPVVQSLCRSFPGSFECRQARAAFESTSAEARLKLQPFYLHESKHDYDKAVAAMEDAFGKGGPEDEGLRLSYLSAMSKVEGRREEAARLLEEMLRDDPKNADLRSQVLPLMNSVRAESDAARGIALINGGRDPEGARLLERAIKTDPENSDASYWKERLAMSRGYAFMERADRLLERKLWDDAAACYRRAASFMPDSPYPSSGLSSAAYGKGDLEGAAAFMARAVALSKGESPQERARLAAALAGLRAEIASGEAARAADRGDHARAAALYRKASAADPQNPWLRHHMASELIELGRSAEARAAIAGEPSSSEDARARSLIYEKLGDYASAAAVLSPYAEDDREIARTKADLEARMRYEEASGLFEGGKPLEALAALGDPDGADGFSLEGRILDALGRHDEAYGSYARSWSLDQAPGTLYLMFENRLDSGDSATAATLGRRLFARAGSLESWQLRGLASGLVELGLSGRSSAIYAALHQAVGADPAERDGDAQSELGWLSSGAGGARGEALDRANARALALARGAREYKDASEYTRALLTPDAPEPWPASALRSRGASDYQQRNVVLLSGFQYYRDSGHPGYSDLKSRLFINNLSFPLLGGRGHVQSETRDVDAGSLSGGPWDDMFGSCFAYGCGLYGAGRQHADRTAIDVGWRRGDVHVDAGNAPSLSSSGARMNGFQFSAGTTLRSGDLSLGIEAYRRPVTASLLSYYGQRDPWSGRWYGAVSRTGVKISPSYSIDGSSGFWGSLAFERFSGKNVASNQAVKAMGGWYSDIFAEPNSSLSLGISGSWWHFKRNLGDYTFGKGGYYSPKDALSAGPSLTYRRRTHRWSVELRASASLS
ncbi:MAG: cellulose synthase subunit BcsC-related outer membrane protein, partial [Succinivibrio sp.]